MAVFPGWAHADEFLSAYTTAMRPRSRRLKTRVPVPPVVLRTDAEHAEEALSALAGMLTRPSRTGAVPLTPYAYVDRPRPSVTALLEQIVARLRQERPVVAGSLRLPTYELVSLLRRVHDSPGRPADGPALEEWICSRHFEAHGTWTLPANSPALTAAFLTVPLDFLLWLGNRLRRPLWRARWNHRFAKQRRYRPLWSNYAGQRTYGNALRHMLRTRTEEGWERLLLAALLAGLNAYARANPFHPGRRRRRLRHALLLNGSRYPTADAGAGPAGDPGNVVARFLERYEALLRESDVPNPALVVVATLPEEPGAARRRGGLRRAAHHLNGGQEPVQRHEVTPGPPEDDAGVTVGPLRQPLLRIRPGTELTCYGVVAATVVAWVLGAFSPPLPRPWAEDGRRPCLTGDHELTKGVNRGVDPRKLHEAALEKIREENAWVDAQKEPERTVTLALLHASPPADTHELRAGGTVPELRGVALSQDEQNRDAQSNDHDVLVRIEPFDAGVQYRHAAERAREIIAEAKRDPNLVGVIGITESRQTTLAALRQLNAAKIPVVTSTATAKRLEVGRYYHGTAPDNEREARIIADFVRHARIVRGVEEPEHCERADEAIVVTDPADVYSDELGKEFAAQYPNTGNRIGYTPGMDDGHPAPNESDLDMQYSVGDVATAVCERVRKNPRSVVYWTSRVREFSSFLDSYQGATGCANEPLTVVGGNELTNDALAGTFRGKRWLHVYHTAHMLPADFEPRSDIARQFSDTYRREYGERDVWLHDGHAALAYDAVQVLAEAASQAITNQVELTRPNVHQYISSVSIEGASGLLQFTVGSPQRPQNKLLTVLYYSDDKASLVLACGRPGQNIRLGEEWTQGDEHHPCPED